MRARTRIVSSDQVTNDDTLKLEAEGLQDGELAILIVCAVSYNVSSFPAGFTHLTTVNQSPVQIRLYQKIWTDSDPDELEVGFGGNAGHRAILVGAYAHDRSTVSFQTINGTAIPRIPALTADGNEVAAIYGVCSPDGNRYKLRSGLADRDLYSSLENSGRTLAVWLRDAPEDGDTFPETQVEETIPHAADSYIGFSIFVKPADPEETIATELYESFRPLVDAYGDPQGFLKTYTRAIGRMFRQVEDIASDHPDGTPGFGTSLDIDKAHPAVVPWLATLSGAHIRYGRSLRDAMRQDTAFNRGRITDLVYAIKKRLSGTKTVYVFERQGGAYRMGISVLASESPGLVILQQVVKDEKAAGLIVTLTEIAGGDFDTLTSTHSDFADVTSTFTDFDDIISDPSQT